MSLRRLVPILSFIGSFAIGLWAPAPAASQGLPVNWWQAQWQYRMPISVKNNSTTATLPVKYSVKQIVNTQALVAAGQMLADCSDLRLVSLSGTTSTQLDRIVNYCGTAQTEVWFALQRSILASATDSGYYLYFGNSAPGTVPNNGMNVFTFYENWEKGTAHWTGAGGLDTANSGTMGTTQISADSAKSPSYSQKFSSKTQGGDAFSGYIPLTASTTYSLSVWAASATDAFLPVGYTPYNASKGAQSSTWSWTNEWVVSSQWAQRSATFKTSTTTAYVKLMSEWWNAGPGTAPVYLDDIVLRLAANTEPALSLGLVQGALPLPTFTSTTATSPTPLGTATTVTSQIAAATGTTISQVVLEILSPQVGYISMSLTSGTNATGTWSAQFTPNQGGTYTYQVVAAGSNGATATSPVQTFSVTSKQPPSISLVSITNPIHVNSAQTIVVQVIDPGVLRSVTLSVNGITSAMTANGTQYSYSWLVESEGTVNYAVSATDTAGNSSTYQGSFDVQAAGEVGVCTWYGCKQGAESFSIDDSTNSCRTELESAGFRGTYYVWQFANGYNSSITTTQPSWVATYSAAGHEIGAHTVDHPCGSPCCAPSCTMSSLQTCAMSQSDVTAYRTDELEPNIASIEQATKLPVLSMAWPCGCTDPARESAASSYFLGARGFYDGVANFTFVDNIDPADPPDPMNLWVGLSIEPGQSLFDPTPIDNAIAENGWAIVVSHGDCSEISYMGQKRNVLWAAPIGTVMKYIKVRDAAVFSNYVKTSTSITFNAVHNLPTFQRQKVNGTYFLPVVYDNAVTLMVHVLSTDNVVSVLLDGSSVAYAIQTIGGTRYVTFDASLVKSRSVQVVLGQDYSLTVQPSSQSIAQGGQTTFTVTSAAIGGYKGTLTFNVTGLPSGSAFTIVPNSVSVPGTSTLTISTTTSISPGTYAFAVNATDGKISHSAAGSLTIIPPPPTLVSVSDSPTSIVGGGTSTGTVVLTAAALTGGMTIALSSSSAAATVPASVTVPAGASSASFAIATSAVSVSTAVTITATDGANPRSTSLTVLPAGIVPWWQSTWLYRLPLTVTNSLTSTPVPVRYSVKTVLNTAQLIAAQQMLSSCADLRVIYFDGVNVTELDRVVNSCNSAQTEVWFALQRAIPASANDASYFIYYGNAAAGAAPSNGMNVFVFHENWENGTAHWISAGGLDTANTGTMGTSQISTDFSISPTHSEKFTVKGSGGDAFSGYVPVAPNTRYMASVWGISATGAYMPVGFDPYDSAKNRGAETWFWTNGWTLSAQWTQRSATFTTSSTTSFIKLKSEWWNEGPGTAPVYLEDVVLRYALTTEPAVTVGTSQSGMPSPTLSNVTATTPVFVGSPVTVSATAVAPTGATIAQVALQVLSPQAATVNLALITGSNGNGTWQGKFTPAQAGSYTYQVTATASNNASAVSPTQSFTVTTPPPTLVSVATNPSVVLGGSTSIGTVALSSGAPSGGMSITLSSNLAAATVPSSVAVPGGASTASFTITTSTVTSSTAVTITASDGVNPRTASLTVQAGTFTAPSYTGNYCVGATTCTLNSVAAGNMIVIATHDGWTPINWPAPLVVADSTGEAVTFDFVNIAAGLRLWQIAPVSNAGTHTLSISNYSGIGNIYAAEFSGVASGNPVEAVAQNFMASSSSDMVGVNTQTANDLLFAYGRSAPTGTMQGTGFTAIRTTPTMEYAAAPAVGANMVSIQPLDATGMNVGVQALAIRPAGNSAPLVSSPAFTGNYCFGANSGGCTISNVAAGDLLIINAYWSGSGSCTISDSLGETITSDRSGDSGPTAWGQLSLGTWHIATVAQAGTHTVSGNCWPSLGVFEFTNQNASNPVDAVGSATGTGTLASTSVTTAYGNDLVYAFCAVSDGATGGGTGDHFGSIYVSPTIEYRAAAANPGTEPATCPVLSGGWIIQQVAIRH